MSIPKPTFMPAELVALLRQARKSVSLDYIKWWANPGTKTPEGKGFEKLGKVVTMHDATSCARCLGSLMLVAAFV